MPPDTTYSTPEQAAARLQVDVGTVYRWIQAGRLPSTKVGRVVRIPNLDDALDRLTRQPRGYARPRAAAAAPVDDTPSHVSAGIADLLPARRRFQ